MPLPTDPMLAQQWHLRNNTPGLLDLNVFGVWDASEGPSYNGAGTRTVVIDDGFDYLHSDLAPNYDTGLDFDFEFNTLDPFGSPSASHGTAVSGIIGAAANGSGVVGVAYGTSLVGYRTAGFITDAWLQDIRDAISNAAVSAQGDVVNISQGIANDANSEFGFGYNAVRFDEIETSIGTAVNSGRGGLGTTIVKSAGNSRSDNYDVNADDWTNDTRQVVVAAVDQNGFVSSYSSYGAAVLVSGFGTPGEVVTTDRTGAAGYNGTDFTSGFNGTSSAAPMVTGIVGLMIDANASLGWRDVQEILAVSARHVGTAVGGGIGGSERYAWQWNGSDTWNGGGQHFSNDYGYGLVDGLAAVRLAETWLLTGTSAATTPTQSSASLDLVNSNVVIPDGNLTGTSFLAGFGGNIVVERMTVQVTFSTTFLADMEIYLISPDGSVSELIRDNAGGADFNGSWTFETQAFRGEDLAGTWTVRIVDDAGGDVLAVTDLVVTGYGAATTDDRYIFTNEYSDYAGVGGHLTAISDSNGGTDTVNAAAVSSGSDIRLDGTNGVIDGVTVSFSGIENAIGGDGADTITGNGGNNQLFGMRGADAINGGSGTDTLTGGTGNDTLNGGSFHDFAYGGDGDDLFQSTNFDFLDSVYGGTGHNTLDLSGMSSYGFTVNLATTTYDYTAGIGGPYVVQDVQDVIGSNQDDVITGDGAANVLNGSGGNDTLNAGAGIDTVFGGEGDDSLIYSYGDAFDHFNGGNGTDTASFNWDASILYDLNLGFYSDAPLSYTRDLIGIENVLSLGSGHDTMIGNADNNLLDGGAGNDSISSGGGSDTMIGGTGNDIYVTDGSDTITELVGEGIDWVKSQVSIILAANVEYLDLLGGFSALNGTGNAMNNRIIANGADNTIAGGAGNDTMIGGAGNDFISGGADADSLVGGTGNDTYVTDGLDTITEAAGAGTDTVQSTVSYGLGANLENLQLLGGGTAITGTGNALDNIITGNAANNSLNGGAGNDTLIGGAGNDTLSGGADVDSMSGGADDDTYYTDGTDTITEAASGGIDTVISTANLGLGLNLENLTLAGAATNATGNSLDNVLTGNGLANLMNGGGGTDTLIGGAGNDTLIGGAGVDSLSGGANDDTYQSDGLDTIVEALGGGIDTVESTGNYALALNVENLVLVGGAALNGTGNALGNQLTGNAFNNTFNGGAGNDTIVGGGGDDTLNGGADADFLNGGLGADQLNGGTGADAFIFTAALGAGNIDTIVGFSVVDDTIRLENAVFTGLAVGGLVAAAFKANLSGLATDASDRIIYETDTGFLYFDSDGTGAASRVQFASLAVGLGLTNLDFTVI